MTPAYRYRAEVLRVIDGTYVMRVDLGFRVSTEQTIRLQGLDTPERGTPEGVRATQAAGDALFGPRTSPRPEVVVETYKDRQPFGRWVADVWVDGLSLAVILRAGGHVKAP